MDDRCTKRQIQIQCVRLLLILALLLVCTFFEGFENCNECMAATGSDHSPEFFNYKTYRLRLNWTASESWNKNNQDGSCNEDQKFSSALNAGVSIKLMLKKVSRSGIYQWSSEKGALPEGSISHNALYEVLRTCPGFPQNIRRSSITGGGIKEAEGRLDIDSRTGEYSIYGFVTATDASIKEHNEPGGTERNENLPSGFSFTSGLSDVTGSIPASGASLKGGPLEIPSPALLPEGKKPMLFSWSLEPWQEDDLPEVSVEPEDGFEEWMPEGNYHQPDKPGKKMMVQIRVHKKGDPASPRKAKLKFSLPHYSEEKGVCLNWPLEAGKNRGLRLRQEDQEEGGKIRIVDEAHGESTEEVQDLRVMVGSYDYGAWGTLRVSATQGNRTLPVKVRSKDTPDLDIPLDEDANRIADVWQKKEAVVGYPANWDAVEVAGQPAKGDGLELYAKYRGLLVMVDGNTLDHKRLPAREKVHFVIDKSNIFDFERWKRTSGIRAYRVSDAIVRSRRVDFNGTSSNGKYAVEIEGIKGSIEKDPLPKDDGTPGSGDAPLQYGYTVGFSPRENERCRVFPDRMRAMLQRVITKMRAAINRPDSPENAAEIAMLDSLGRSRDAIKKRLDAINDGEIDVLTQMMVKLTAIHEMGHACGIKGHLNEKGAEDETLLRTPSCPMNYLYTKERRLFVLDRTLGGEGVFCSVEPDSCWKKLDVR